MDRAIPSFVFLALFATPVSAHDVDSLAGKRIVFLGDSITQAGGYVASMTYFLEKLNPAKDFDVYSLGLSSETVSGLSEEGHAGGKFPRPCLFERLSRLLEKVKPDVVFACYGMNDGIYKPLDPDRFAAFRKGITKLIEQCQAAGVKQVFLVTPPIYDFAPKPGKKMPPHDELVSMIRTLLDSFGPRRLMWASDAPYQVQGVNTYKASIGLVRDRMDFLSKDDREWLLAKTAEKVFFYA